MANEDGQFTDEEVLKAQQDQSVALVYVRVNDSVVELGSTSASNVRVFGVSINASEARVNKLDRLFRDDVGEELKRMRDAEASRRNAEKEPAPIASVNPVEDDVDEDGPFAVG